MSTRPLVVITTRLPPATCGIGTYSWWLRQHWPNESRRIEFLVVENTASATTADRVTAFENRGVLLARELERIGAADVLLHYAGRAYHRFGCPTWLPTVLANWKRKFPGSRLMIYVHEMPGEFPMTSRHFWLGRVDSWIIKRLAGNADVLITNTEHHAAKLRQLSGRPDIYVVPVGSNIGVAPASPTPRSRTEFALFGLPFGRQQTLQLFAEHLRRWRVQGRLTRLHIIGPHDEGFTGTPEDTEVHHGILPPEKVAALLRQVQFALSNVSEETWSKSTTFMACAANYCPVIIGGSRPGFGPLSNAVAADEVETISDAELARRSAALAHWYNDNGDWSVTARRIAALWPTEADE